MDLKSLADLRFVYLDAPKVTGKSIDPEAFECMKFADLCRGFMLDGKLDAVWFHIANEFAGPKRYVFGAVLKAMGKISGAPDYVFLWKGGCGCLEFKRPDIKGKPKGRQSDKQKALQRICERFEVPYKIAKTSEEGVKILKEWGALKGAS